MLRVIWALKRYSLGAFWVLHYPKGVKIEEGGKVTNYRVAGY